MQNRKKLIKKLNNHLEKELESFRSKEEYSDIIEKVLLYIDTDETDLFFIDDIKESFDSIDSGCMSCRCKFLNKLPLNLSIKLDKLSIDTFKYDNLLDKWFY